MPADMHVDDDIEDGGRGGGAEAVDDQEDRRGY